MLMRVAKFSAFLLLSFLLVGQLSATAKVGLPETAVSFAENGVDGTLSGGDDTPSLLILPGSAGWASLATDASPGARPIDAVLAARGTPSPLAPRAPPAPSRA